MMSREIKNKVFVNEIKKERTKKISKAILKCFSFFFLLFALLFAYIYFIGVKGLVTNEIKIVDNNIPTSFHGIKIVHITDILYGSTIHEKEIMKLQREIALINPDIVFFTGNIFTKQYEPNEKDINILNSFFKTLPYTIGKYAVLGNLDTNNFDLIMENTNFTILNNERINVHHFQDEFISIVGINKNSSENNISNLTDNYTITLINNYDDYSLSHSNLIFAGNNLGGEIRLINTPLLGENKYQDKYYEQNGTKVYISSGLGTLHHMRLFNHPSINVYRLINN